jgi:hypothetical protein
MFEPIALAYALYLDGLAEAECQRRLINVPGN